MFFLSVQLLAISAVLSAAVDPQHPLQLETDEYQDNSVLRCLVVDDHLSQFLSLVEEHQMDLWTSRIVKNAPIDVRVSSQQSDMLLSVSSFGCQVWIPDVRSLLDDEAKSLASFDAETEDFFATFHPYDDLVSHVKQLAEEYPSLAKFVPSIGKTWEGRDIAVVHITSPNTPETGKKKTVWFDGGIHAREWISSHVSVFLIEKLLTTYGKDETVTRMLDNIEFVASPHINPDGYEYSRTRSRMWRKNRRQNNDRTYGVDLNRNYDIKWGQGGSSRSPGSETYMGPSAASEPEVQACSNYIKSVNAVVGINFHSYGQLILRPYGYGWEDHPTEALNKELGDGMRDAIKNKSGQKYTSERSVGLYPVTGGMDDWMTSQGMIGFTIELRDTGRHGFVLPKEQIIPTAEEIWEAMKFMGPFVFDKVAARQ